ncbi:MAG: PQQ-binding-like beta-propeller repeat protein [Planctomycetaceae bacterium]
MLACLTALCVAQTASAQPRAVLPANRDLSRYGLELHWWGQAVIDPGQDQVSNVNVDEDIVYLQSDDGIVTAFQAESGKKLWAQLLGSPYKVLLPMSTNERDAFVCNGQQLFGLNKFTGEVAWELKLPHQPSTSPEADNDRVFLGMVDGSVYCYDLARIRKLAEQGRLPRWSANAYQWRHKAAQEITSPPISNGQTVVFGSLNGTIYSVKTLDHRLVFQFETDEPIPTPIGRGADSLFVVSEDTRMYCLNRESGLRRWTFTAGVPIRTEPRVIGGSVYVAPVREGLYCLSAAGGTINWHQSRAAAFLAATDNYVFAADSLNNVLLLSPQDGGVLGELPLRGYTQLLPNDRTNRLFMCSSDGLVICIREKGQEFPLYHKFPERRPILPELAADESPAESAKQ